MTGDAGVAWEKQGRARRRILGFGVESEPEGFPSHEPPQVSPFPPQTPHSSNPASQVAQSGPDQFS
jgi:hypothetical protein